MMPRIAPSARPPPPSSWRGSSTGVSVKLTIMPIEERQRARVASSFQVQFKSHAGARRPRRQMSLMRARRNGERICELSLRERRDKANRFARARAAKRLVRRATTCSGPLVRLFIPASPTGRALSLRQRRRATRPGVVRIRFQARMRSLWRSVRAKMIYYLPNLCFVIQCGVAPDWADGASVGSGAC